MCNSTTRRDSRNGRSTGSQLHLDRSRTGGGRGEQRVKQDRGRRGERWVKQDGGRRGERWWPQGQEGPPGQCATVFQVLVEAGLTQTQS